MTAIHETREAWLEAAVRDALRGFMAGKGVTVPEVRIGIGFGHGGSRGKAVGECNPRSASPDGVNEITLRITEAEPITVLATLVHELVHAALDCKGAHGKTFATMAEVVGLIPFPSMRSTVAGFMLNDRLTLLAEALGDYPGEGLRLGERKKQPIRNLARHCTECLFLFRTTRKQIENAETDGPLRCPRANCPGDVVEGSPNDGAEDE